MKPKSKGKSKAKAKAKPKAKKQRFSELEFLRDQNRRARMQMERSDPVNARMIFGEPMTEQENSEGEPVTSQPGQVHGIAMTRDLEGEKKAEEGAE